MFSDKLIFRLFGGLGILVFFVVLARLIDLQIIDSKKYTDFVNSQINAHLSIYKNRGYIYDRDGNILARNKSSASLYAFRKNIDDYRKFVRDLSAYGISLDKKAKDSLTKSDSFTWVARRIDLDKAREMVKKIKGLEYVNEEARFYPEGSLMANVIGFTGVDNQGRTGIEYALDDELAGTKVILDSLKDSRGKYIFFDDRNDVLKSDTEVYTTISSRIQLAGEYFLKKGANIFGAKDGSVIAIDVKTGDIILAASVQSFNPHVFNNYSKNAWKNHAFSYVYEPGSIFKTVSFSFLADTGRLNKSALIDTSKKITIGGYTYNDTHNYGLLTVDEIYSRSSNIGTAALISKEKNKDFYTFLKNSGFGSKAGIYGLTEESGLLKDVSHWSLTSRTSIAIGYEVMVTPLQMARFYAAVANGGVMVKPRIISKVIRQGKEFIPESEKVRIMSAETSDYILELMRKTVEGGTGVNAKTQLVQIAGKTGTASIYDNISGSYSKRNYSASFAGVFPAEDPSIAMVVVYESPTSSIYGGSTAANVFRQVAEYIAVESGYLDTDLMVAYEY